MRLRYTRPALTDLASILDYIAIQSPEAARRVHLRIRSMIDLLLTHPFLGIRTTDPAIRRLTVTPFPYFVFYEVGDGEIVIHAIRHAARRPFAPGPI